MRKTYSRITRRILPLLLASLWLVGASGCLIDPGTGNGFTNGAGYYTTIPGGAKAVQVIFTDTASAGTGSFAVPASGGTVPGAGNGLQATQLFNADGSRLTTSSAGGPSDPNWPAWLTSVEIGISGPSNTSATNTYCANFGTGTAMCKFNAASGTTNCDVSNRYGISEYDCDTGGAGGASWGTGDATGNGTQTDGVYIRANFNRASLGVSENMMVVVNYAASGFNPAPSNPASCFNASASVPFSPEGCADFTWRVFQTYGPTYSWVQPFLMLAPPMYSYVNGNTVSTSSTTAETKQFVIPFAGDANLSTIVLGRTGTTLSDAATTNFGADCQASGGGGSPLCSGIVFYSLTFFRI